MDLNWNDKQTTLLRAILDREYRDLRYEIADTDNSVYKRGLKEREEMLEGMLADIGGPLADRAES